MVSAGMGTWDAVSTSPAHALTQPPFPPFCPSFPSFSLLSLIFLLTSRPRPSPSPSPVTGPLGCLGPVTAAL